MDVDPPRKGAVQTDDDLYSRIKKAQRTVEMLDIQEEYIKDEMKNLKRELIRAQEEVKRIQARRRESVGALGPALHSPAPSSDAVRPADDWAIHGDDRRVAWHRLDDVRPAALCPRVVGV